MNLLCVIYLILALYAIYIAWSKKDASLHEFDLARTNSLKAILAICIALVHLNICCFKQAGYHYPIIQDFNGAWGQWCVVLFFMISGYGLAYSYIHKGKSYLVGFLPKRLSKIIIPLIISILIYNINYLIVNGFWGGKWYEGMEHTWYVYTIIVLYLLFYIVTKLNSNIKISCGILFALSVIYISLARYVLDIEWKWWASILGFNTGMYIQLYESNLKTLLSRYRKIISLSIPFGIFCIYAAGHFNVSEYAFSIGWPLVTIALIYLCGIWQNKVLAWIGKYSYEIYLVHFTLFPFYFQWPIQGHLGNISFTLFYIVAIAVLAIVIWQISFVIQKFYGRF